MKKYLLLDLPDSLEIGGTIEDIAAEKQQLDEVAGNITTSYVQTPGQMGQ